MAGLQNCGLKILQWNCNGLFAHLNEFKQHLSQNSYMMSYACKKHS